MCIGRKNNANKNIDDSGLSLKQFLVVNLFPYAMRYTLLLSLYYRLEI